MDYDRKNRLKEVKLSTIQQSSLAHRGENPYRMISQLSDVVESNDMFFGQN